MKATRYENTFPDMFLRAISEPSIRTKERLKDELPRLRRCTTGDIRKQVHWSDRSRVILVPCRQDYSKNGFVHDIWYENCDYDLFKLSARDEVVSLMQLKNLDLSSAMSELYQPKDKKNNLSEQDNQKQNDGNSEKLSVSNEFGESEFNENFNLSDMNISSTTCNYDLPSDFSIRSSTPKPVGILSRRSYSRQGSKESVESQSSNNSSDKKSINFLEIQSEKGQQEKGQLKQIKKGSAVTKAIHPLGLLVND